MNISVKDMKADHASNTTDGSKNATFTRDENLASIEIGVQAAIFILAVAGNSTVLGVLLRNRKRMSRMNLLMVHLSLADLFVAFGSVLPQLIWDITFQFHGGDFLCKLVKYLQVVAIYASSYILVMTALDRYIAICYPFISHTWSSGKVLKMVMVAWGLSLLFSLPQFVIFSYTLNAYGLYDCWATFDPEWTLTFYITFFTVVVYIIPTLILIFCYGNICIAVWRSGKIGEKLTPKIPLKGPNLINYTTGKGNGVETNITPICRPNSTTDLSQSNSLHHGITKAKLRTIKLTMTVVTCYLLCWSPFFIAQMWAVYDETAPFYGPAYTIILLLASLNSCTNPWIYLAFTDSVLDNLRKCCKLSCRGRVKTGTRHVTFSSSNLRTMKTASATNGKTKSTCV